MSIVDGEARRILRRHQVKAGTGLSRQTCYRRLRAGTFPLATAPGECMIGWRAADIERFLANPARYGAAASRPQSDAHDARAVS
ncbi:MAG TPA: AlpA family phage regulatory protein [Paraburkholderia sp.]|nr:AlpA family phage regulatory protein [Paraburkholderia sp.]